MRDEINSNDMNGQNMTNSVNNDVVIRGNVKITVQDEERGEYLHFNDHNIIVYGARKVMAHLLAEAPTANVIYKLQLGTGGHGVDILTPIAPSRSDTTLEEPFVSVQPPAGRVYQPVGDENEVKFSFVLGKEEGNGTGAVAYTEAGLFTSGSVMFARETFPALIKNSTRQITFEWTIVF